MKFDSTVTLAVIVSVCALVSPIITAVTNNIFLIIMKHREHKEELYKQTVLRKNEIIENYILNTGSYLTFPCNSNEDEYGKSYSLVLIYLPEELFEKVVALNTLIKEKGVKEARKVFPEVIKEIKPLLQTRKKGYKLLQNIFHKQHK